MGTNGLGGPTLGPGDIIALVTGLISILIAFAALMHAAKCSHKFTRKKKETHLLTLAIANSYSPRSPPPPVSVPAPPPAPPPPAKLHAPTRNHPSHSAEAPRLDDQETVVDDIRQHHSHYVLIYNDTRRYPTPVPTTL